MSRYRGPKFKKARRYGISLLENGKEFSKGKRRTYAPGQHGNMRKKMSEYGQHLYEKQKLRYIYGINERQFATTFFKSLKIKGVAGTNFLVMLESRLDNLVYRLGFASTRAQARQLVSHNHILVDGKKANIPSMQIKLGQKISIKEKSQKLDLITQAINAKNAAEWLKREGFTGEYVRFPERSELNQEIKEALVVEYYSK